MSAEPVAPIVPRAKGKAAWRIAALVVFLGLPLTAAAVVASAMMSGLDAAAIADHAESMSRTIIHQLDRRPAATQAPVDTTTRYLASPNAGLARAELQALASRMIEAGGGRVIEMQSTDATEPDPANHVSVDVTCDVTNAGLLDLLYATETGLPLLTVPRLDIRDETTGEAQAGAGGLLRATITLQGSWKAAAQ